MTRSSATSSLLLAGILAAILPLACGRSTPEPAAQTQEGATIPITATSQAAIDHYLRGRSEAEHLRLPAGREEYREALRLDPEFSMAWLGLARTASSTPEAQEALQHAMSGMQDLSTGERLLISAFEAGIQDRLEARGELLEDLVRIYPEDARAHFHLALHHADLNDDGAVLRHARRVTEIDPEFAPAYNALGYAQMDLQRYDEADAAFRRYMELLPSQPNPYDSYGEYLLKVGRFDEALDSYRRALEVDSTFSLAYVGLGNVYLAMDRLDAAREAFAHLLDAAESLDEQSEALRWTAVAWVHEGDHASALESIDALYDLARVASDREQMHDAQEMAGEILLQAGAIDEANRRFDLALDVMKLADAPATVLEAARRDRTAEEALTSLALGDPNAAARRLDDFEASLTGHHRPDEIARLHYLRGVTALAMGDAESALAHLEQADLDDPRVVYQIARAREVLGTTDLAEEMAYRAANWNGIVPAWAWVRRDAEAMVERLD